MEEAQTKAEPGGRWLIKAVELGDSAALGGDVRLELSPRVTVLVGRNGAGKSALLEALVAAASGATGVVKEPEPDPARFACEIWMPGVFDEDVVRYECRWRPQAGASTDTEADTEGERRFAEIEETCRFISDIDTALWRLADGKLTRNDGSTDVLPRGRGLLNWWIAGKIGFVFNRMVEPLHDLLGLIRGHYVRAGVPRGSALRSEIIIPYPWRLGRWEERAYEHIPLQLRRLALTIAEWSKNDVERLDEFTAVVRRLKLFDRLDIRTFPGAGPQGRDLVSVLADETNLGLLSDGTLRVAEILSLLIAENVQLLLIEEPEIAVHPGLLARLLHEIDAYSTDRQVILSTQSPQVVSWARPDQLRLVERAGDRTKVRALSETESARVDAYLHDEGTLGEYVYAGGLDG